MLSEPGSSSWYYQPSQREVPGSLCGTLPLDREDMRERDADEEGDDRVTFLKMDAYMRSCETQLDCNIHSQPSGSKASKDMAGNTDTRRERDFVARVIRDPADPVGKLMRELGVLPSDTVAGLLARDLAQAPHKIRDKYGKRREESAAQRAEHARARNKEHARATRQRRRMLETVLRAHVARMQDALCNAVLLPISRSKGSPSFASTNARVQARQRAVADMFGRANLHDFVALSSSHFPMLVTAYVWTATRSSPPRRLVWWGRPGLGRGPPLLLGQDEATCWQACIRDLQSLLCSKRLGEESAGHLTSDRPEIVAIKMVGDALSAAQGSSTICKFGLVIESHFARYSVMNESMYAQVEFSLDSQNYTVGEAENVRAVTLYLDLAALSDSLAQLRAFGHE